MDNRLKEKTLLVTGASGFIGRHLVQAALQRNLSVIALSKSGVLVSGAKQNIQWSLGDDLDESIVANLSFAIHLAHDFAGEDGARKSILGTLKLAEKINKAGSASQIFVSSYSAGPHAVSRYGKTKTTIERGLRGLSNITIARPGLVIGNGGLFGKISFWCQRSPIIPLPDGGNAPVPVISINRLCAELIDILHNNKLPLEANIFLNEFTSLRELVNREATSAGRKVPMIIPVPSLLLMALLKLAEGIGVDLKISSDSLAGFMQNKYSPHKSTIEE